MSDKYKSSRSYGGYGNYDANAGNGIVDSNNKWKSASSKTKGVLSSICVKGKDTGPFAVGDKVIYRNSMLNEEGTILKYCGQNSWKQHEYYIKFPRGEVLCNDFEIKGVKEVAKSSNPVCECGAEKTFRQNCSPMHHALYCSLRGRDDD